MSLIKNLEIDGKQVPFKASAAIHEFIVLSLEGIFIKT